MSSIAPTLLGRKTENCLTSAPWMPEAVSGEFRAMSKLTARCAKGRHRAGGNYLTGELLFANGMLGEGGRVRGASSSSRHGCHHRRNVRGGEMSGGSLSHTAFPFFCRGSRVG